MGERSAGFVEEWTRRALAELERVNRGVRDTLERMHEGEDLVIDQAFGAMTQQEKLELERDRDELAKLERKAQEAPGRIYRSPAVLAWIARKVSR